MVKSVFYLYDFWPWVLAKKYFISKAYNNLSIYILQVFKNQVINLEKKTNLNVNNLIYPYYFFIQLF